jgi:hypothetical protein
VVIGDVVRLGAILGAEMDSTAAGLEGVAAPFGAVAVR